MAIIADFMLVYLPAPTVSLRPALGVNAGSLAKFFHNCPDNAFQVFIYPIAYFHMVSITCPIFTTISWYLLITFLFAGCSLWNIIFLITEDRCNCGTYNLVTSVLSFFSPVSFG